MKVKVEVEIEVEPGNNDSEYWNDEYSVFIPKVWCAPVDVGEPTVVGVYRLRNNYGTFYASKNFGHWELFGTQERFTWDKLGPVLEATLIEIN